MVACIRYKKKSHLRLGHGRLSDGLQQILDLGEHRGAHRVEVAVGGLHDDEVPHGAPAALIIALAGGGVGRVIRVLDDHGTAASRRLLGPARAPPSSPCDHQLVVVVLKAELDAPAADARVDSHAQAGATDGPARVEHQEPRASVPVTDEVGHDDEGHGGQSDHGQVEAEADPPLPDGDAERFPWRLQLQCVGLSAKIGKHAFNLVVVQRQQRGGLQRQRVHSAMPVA
mmetsp:Transcript_4227/g.15808  ORF Transcript_4227/g.15808 Transcript_4227/m.15808 type:complete len:228 (-) Transcript_4227:287-970(-)